VALSLVGTVVTVPFTRKRLEILDQRNNYKWGHAVALNVGRSWVRFPMVSLELFIDIILPAALWP